MTNFASILARTAVLAIYAAACADIQRRELATQVPSVLRLLNGQEVPCAMKSWSGEGLDGDCGVRYWEDLTPKCVLALLRECVPSNDAAAAADGAAVVLSLSDSESAGKAAIQWAKRIGATDEQVEAARKEAVVLKAARLERVRKTEAARLSALSPEAGVFAATAWIVLKPDEFAAASVEMLEAARALLSRAGSSGSLHETDHIALFAESGDDAFREIAASLEVFYDGWEKVLVGAGALIAPQGRIPVVIVNDRDRWRLIVAAAAGSEPQKYQDAIVVYPTTTTAAGARAMVLVAPNSDRSMQRYNASVGLARAMLHYSGSPQRGPAWLNEGLPRVMADVATPLASMDDTLRKPGLNWVRGGGTFLPLLASNYSDAAWTADATLARSLSYMFVRWMYDQNPRKLFQFAKVVAPSETIDVRFRKCFGVTLDSAAAQAARWFQTND
ncbi:MAG: hypothetical protein DWI10_04730 [Planctomycetota bacterium]|nr:MAG: hypothetical protein DWI10_04730 [Planctomycetota bacterium]